MTQTHTSISPELKDWIAQQPVYFLASAPLQSDGHINLSPRGLDSLRVIGENEVIMLDLTGSGNETAAHLLQNQRLTIMLCAFTGKPRILRLYGKGTVIQPGSDLWSDYREQFADHIPGVRQIFHLQVERIQTSCGFGVPLMEYMGQRDLLLDWAIKKGPQGILEYQRNKNTRSIDGLPAPRSDNNE